MPTKTTSKRKRSQSRTDGRKSLQVYLDEEIIKRLKKAALDHDRTAYEITEDAVKDWLNTHHKGVK